jgi:hypothetical protein
MTSLAWECIGAAECFSSEPRLSRGLAAGGEIQVLPLAKLRLDQLKNLRGKFDLTHELIAQSSESSFYCIGGDSLQEICYPLNILLL